MRVDLIASQPHYLDHLAPVWRALTSPERGTVTVPPELRPRCDALGVGHGDALGRHYGHRFALCAGYRDAAGAGVGRDRVVLMEHGVGQTYIGGDSAYAGGPARPATWVYLCPNWLAAAANRAANPDAVVHVVGSPYLDVLAAAAAQSSIVGFDAAISFHHQPVNGPPETGSTWRYWWPAIAGGLNQLVVVGHGHPRDHAAARQRFLAAGYPYLHDFGRVVQATGVYVTDNSSCLYYAAALGLSVVVLNSPQYRRDVHHGLRFWDMADVGWQISEPDQLRPTIYAALEHPDRHKTRAAGICGELFPYRDGHCAERAADAVRALA